MNTTTSTTTTSTAPAYNTYNGNTNKKYKPYRNRPSKRQALLELLSFLLILAAGPAFLGGAFSIFICIATFALGLIGLFTWTRRHAVLFSLLALAVIAACVVNIILRAAHSHHAQCLPFFHYGNQFNRTVTNTTTLGANGASSSDVSSSYNFLGGNQHPSDHGYNNSIWCGNRVAVYVTNGIIIALAIPALLIALAMLKKRNTTNNNNTLPRTNATSTTTTTRTAIN
jgi:hypothetical protein